MAPLLDSSCEPEELLAEPPELPPAVRRRLADPCTRERARQWQENAEREGMSLLTPRSPLYPERMRRGLLRPLVLFARGRVELLGDPRWCAAGTPEHRAMQEAY